MVTIFATSCLRSLGFGFLVIWAMDLSFGSWNLPIWGLLFCHRLECWRMWDWELFRVSHAFKHCTGGTRFDVSIKSDARLQSFYNAVSWSWLVLSIPSWVLSLFWCDFDEILTCPLTTYCFLYLNLKLIYQVWLLLTGRLVELGVRMSSFLSYLLEGQRTWSKLSAVKYGQWWTSAYLLT